MRNLILAIALMTGLSTMAQRSHQEKSHKGYTMNMSPEQMATLQTKRMTLALDLTDAQQKQIQNINLENAAKRAEKMKEMKAKKESGELKKPTSDDRYAMQLAMLDHQIAQKNNMKKILDKDQYAKWEKMKKSREGHQKGKAMRSYNKRGHSK